MKEDREWEWEAVIGLEVHAQLATKTKMWCGCEVTPHALENTKTCEVCTGHPGSLPVLNRQVIHCASLLAMATHCKINHISRFDRKNYFYPDLPKGYQISQYHAPFAEDGFLTIWKGEEGRELKVGLERIQIEEDTGKSIHKGGYSLIDLNRAGTPLLEIVGRPDLRTPSQASTYLKKLHSLLIHLEICHGNLQEGNFRCDVNVSLRPRGTSQLGTRTEIKNLNSFRNVEKAIHKEIERQRNLLQKGQKIEQQTLNFDGVLGKLTPMRAKSDVHDYRYFPEPDLLPLHLDEKELQRWEKELPELPDAKQARFETQYGLPPYDARILASDKNLSEYFETALKTYKGESKKLSNWIMVELLRLLNESALTVAQVPVPPHKMSNLLNFVHQGLLSGKMAKEVFERMFDQEGKSAEEVIRELGFVQMSDEAQLSKIAQEIVKAHPNEVAKYLSGNKRLLGFFVGQVMKSTRGQANPQLANDILKKILKKEGEKEGEKERKEKEEDQC